MSSILKSTVADASSRIIDNQQFLPAELYYGALLLESARGSYPLRNILLSKITIYLLLSLISADVPLLLTYK